MSELDWAFTNATLADCSGRWCVGVLEGAIATVTEGDRDLERLWATITTNAAQALRLQHYGITPGNPADLVILEAATIPEASLHQADRLAVIKQGNLIAQNP